MFIFFFHYLDYLIIQFNNNFIFPSSLAFKGQLNTVDFQVIDIKQLRFLRMLMITIVFSMGPEVQGEKGLYLDH